MKIGIEAQRLFRKKKHGMDMVVLEMIRELQKIDTGNEYVIFVKPDEDNNCIQATENFKIVELNGGPYPIWEQFILPKAAKTENCDVLHCTSNTAPLNINIPLMITLHDIIYLEGIRLGKNGGTWYQKIGNIYRKWNVPRAVKKTDKIITVSNYEKKRIDKYFGFTDNQVEVVYNGFGKHFRQIKNRYKLEELRKKYYLPKKFIFFLGNTDPKKNTKNVLKAYAQYVRNYNSIPLVMLDFGEEKLKKMLESIGAPNIRKHIKLMGYIPNSELPAFYNMSEVFLYPSLRESFGIPILEAMACGTPVITSNTSSMPEVAGDAAYIVDPQNPDEITAGIHNLVIDKKLRQMQIENGFQRINSFSWSNTARDVLKIYQSIEIKENARWKEPEIILENC